MSTWDALSQMPREQAQRREDQYMPRKKMLDGMGRPQSCGDMSELDAEGHTSNIPGGGKGGRTWQKDGMA